MRQKTTAIIFLSVMYLLLLVSCSNQEEIEPESTVAVATSTQPVSSPTPGTPTATPLTEPLYGLADVESLEIVDQGSRSQEILVRIRGILPNGCTEIEEMVAQQDGDVFNLAVTTVQQPGQDCDEAEVPFDEVLPIDTAGLEAGSYAIRVNDLQESFTLDAGEQAQEEPEATPGAAAASAISGLVWHDLCAGSAEETIETEPGCISGAGGGFQANGILEDEPGIEGIQVTLGSDECPAEAMETAVTDSGGNYRFDNLAQGTYCVFIDISNENNQEILLPGTWTAPEGGAPEIAVDLGEGETLESVDFGWDYQFLPIPEVDLESCSNSFEFVEDLNIPDDTGFPPGAEFTKEWLLRNNGTCPWSEAYSIVFVGGDQMSAEPAIPLSQPVAPGQELEVAVEMIAPDEPGTYRGNWQVANANGEPFGINGFIDDAFWLQIAVEEGAPPLTTVQPNSGAVGGVVWDDFCLNSDPGRGCIEFPEDSGIYIGDGTLNPGESRLSEITITLARGACPADGNPPSAESVIDTARTDGSGLYRFENLPDESYCIFMDALSEENVDLLIPGNWTWPATGVGRYAIVLDPGEQILDLDFGWDFLD